MSTNANGGPLELILVRHAKSDWCQPGLLDHDRPLNARGLRDAPLMAQRLADARVRVDRIVSSTALRARTTATEFGTALGVEVELDPELYASSAATLAAKAAGSGVRRVMLVAHNPGLSDLAYRASAGEIAHLPTCSVARFTWNIDDAPETAWGRIDWDRAATVRLDTPRGSTI